MPPRIPLRRRRRTKVVATLGPASSSPEMIERLFRAGADVFRLNFSHGSHADHADRIAAIRALEERAELLISLYYTEELTMKEIGQVLGVSESRVSQMHSSILARLKAQMADRRKEFQQATAV